MHFFAGRSFESNTLTGAPRDAVISCSLAKLLWPNADAPGKMVKVTIPSTGVAAGLQVTGVVDDARTTDPKSSPQPAVYLPFRGTALAVVLPWYVITDTREPTASLEKLINASVANQLPGMGNVYSYAVQDRLAGLLKSARQEQEIAIMGASVVAVIALIGVYSSLMYFVILNGESSRYGSVAARRLGK